MKLINAKYKGETAQELIDGIKSVAQNGSIGFVMKFLGTTGTTYTNIEVMYGRPNWSHFRDFALGAFDFLDPNHDHSVNVHNYSLKQDITYLVSADIVRDALTVLLQKEQ